ncbi:hypothetical protein DMH08_24875 [Actinomadura sp. WAC 06369]|nr:hypothetical protein DMH08_24875 [Actinomadura sp. WAC 06369]
MCSASVRLNSGGSVKARIDGVSMRSSSTGYSSLWNASGGAPPLPAGPPPPPPPPPAPPAPPAAPAAARRLARRLRAAAHRDRVTTVHTSPTPPGRLSMRGALAADAQRAAGVTPTAEPFTQTTRRHVPAPPLRIGIACDVSGSMKAFADPVASPPTFPTPTRPPSSSVRGSVRSPALARPRPRCRSSKQMTPAKTSSRPSTPLTPPSS